MGNFEPARERKKYERRKKTVLKKIWEFATMCNVDIYVIVVHDRETTVVSSSDEYRFPPDTATLPDPIFRYSVETLGEWLHGVHDRGNDGNDDSDHDDDSTEEDESRIQLPILPPLRKLL